MNTREKGRIGEQIACIYLEKHGYFVIQRNYLKKYGEIDIIALKDGVVNFFEVKSVIDKGNSKGYRSEDNVHELKLRKLRRVIQSYLDSKHYGIDAEFKFHVITVRTIEATGKSYVRILENIII